MGLGVVRAAIAAAPGAGTAAMAWDRSARASPATDGVPGARAARGPRGRGPAGGGLATARRARGLVSRIDHAYTLLQSLESTVLTVVFRMDLRLLGQQRALDDLDGLHRLGHHLLRLHHHHDRERQRRRRHHHRLRPRARPGHRLRRLLRLRLRRECERVGQRRAGCHGLPRGLRGGRRRDLGRCAAVVSSVQRNASWEAECPSTWKRTMSDTHAGCNRHP